MDIHQKAENPKYFKQPHNQYNYNNYVEDIFDFTIHRNVVVYKPDKNANKNYYKCNSKEWHKFQY